MVVQVAAPMLQEVEYRHILLVVPPASTPTLKHVAYPLLAQCTAHVKLVALLSITVGPAVVGVGVGTGVLVGVAVGSKVGSGVDVTVGAGVLVETGGGEVGAGVFVGVLVGIDPVGITGGVSSKASKLGGGSSVSDAVQWRPLWPINVDQTYQAVAGAMQLPISLFDSRGT